MDGRPPGVGFHWIVPCKTVKAEERYTRNATALRDADVDFIFDTDRRGLEWMISNKILHS